MLIVQQHDRPALLVRRPDIADDRFVLTSLRVIVAIGVVVGWLVRPDDLPPRGPAEAARRYLVVAAALAAGGARCSRSSASLFGPTGYFSPSTDGPDDAGAPLIGGAEPDRPRPRRSARPDRRRSSSALVVGALVYCWAATRRQRPAVPGLGRRPDDRPRRGRHLGADRGRRLRRRDRRRHRRARRAVPDARPERVPVRVRPGPDQRPARQDDQLHDRLRHPRRRCRSPSARCISRGEATVAE